MLDRTVVVLRNHTVTCTNFRHLMAPALESRATTFAVPSTKKSRKKSKFVSRNASVVTRDTVQVKMYYNSWSKCLQTYSALQWRYTGMEAVGMIPPMDDMLFVVRLFHNILFHSHVDAPRSPLAVPNFVLVNCRLPPTRGFGFQYPKCLGRLVFVVCCHFDRHMLDLIMVCDDRLQDIKSLIDRACERVHQGDNPLTRAIRSDERTVRRHRYSYVDHVSLYRCLV